MKPLMGATCEGDPVRFCGSDPRGPSSALRRAPVSLGMRPCRLATAARMWLDDCRQPFRGRGCSNGQAHRTVQHAGSASLATTAGVRAGSFALTPVLWGLIRLEMAKLKPQELSASRPRRWALRPECREFLARDRDHDVSQNIDACCNKSKANRRSRSSIWVRAGRDLKAFTISARRGRRGRLGTLRRDGTHLHRL